MTFALIIRTPEQRAAEARAQALAATAARIDQEVEAQARALGYNSAAHLAGYVGSTVPDWAAEARAFVAWRDSVWLAAQALLAEGTAPDPETVLQKLPAWPA